MSQSLANILLHTVFSTKDRRPLLDDANVRSHLYSQMTQLFRSCDCPLISINGTANHVHVLHVLSRSVAVKELLRHVKSHSSSWIKRQSRRFRDFGWQRGYGVFSVSPSVKDKVIRYIRDQETHHARYSFQDEFRAICRLNGVEIDERYVWE